MRMLLRSTGVRSSGARSTKSRWRQRHGRHSPPATCRRVQWQSQTRLTRQAACTFGLSKNHPLPAIDLVKHKYYIFRYIIATMAVMLHGAGVRVAVYRHGLSVRRHEQMTSIAHFQVIDSTVVKCAEGAHESRRV